MAFVRPEILGKMKHVLKIPEGLGDQVFFLLDQVDPGVVALRIQIEDVIDMDHCKSIMRGKSDVLQSALGLDPNILDQGIQA